LLQMHRYKKNFVNLGALVSSWRKLFLPLLSRMQSGKAQRHEAAQSKIFVNHSALVLSWRYLFCHREEEKSHTCLSADRDAQMKECGRGGATSKTYLDNKIYLCIRDKELSSSICLC